MKYGHKDLELREWEKNILVHLNSVNLVERDDPKTSYVKFKLFKRDIYGLALVYTGNLVKGTLVSSEFWKMIGGNLQKLKGAKIFTSIDACGAYHAIQIEEGSRDCTAFISPFGTFRYIRMPFGLSNAGSIYSRMLDLALAHLPVEYRLSYLDDILVYSMDTWDHLKHLKSIVEAHTKAGIKI